jgi:sporulation protein YlmC with PRC-barrel domain
VIRASDLQGKPVRRENGEEMGRVYEIRSRGSRIAALICGSRGFFQRLTGTAAGHRVPWEQVLKITAAEIIIADKGDRLVRGKRGGR